MIKTIALVSLMAAVPASCQHTAVISDYCQFAGVIRPSRQDTTETLRQVAAANAKYRAVCQAAKK